MMTMPLSTDTAYTELIYPSLKSAGQAKADTVAYAHGHTAGYTAGLRQATADNDTRRQEMEAEHSAALLHAQARTDRALALLAGAVEAVGSAVLPVVTDAQDALIEAAMDLAEAIIGVELGDGELSSRSALARALATTPPAGTVTVRMHPNDLSVLGDAELPTGVRLAADPSLGRGDAVAEYEHGHLNATVASALARARAALLGEGA
jgi:flagellar assembly protein FliH